MNNYRLLILPVLVSGLLLQPLSASANGGCSEGKKGVIEKTISSNYSDTMKSPEMKKKTNSSAKNVAMKVQMLKMWLKNSSKNDLNEFDQILDGVMAKVKTTHPRYDLLNDLSMYIKDLIEGTTMPSESIVDLVIATPEVSILKDVVVALGLVDTLSSEGPFTVFAPTNAAFEKLLSDLDMSFDELAANTELLKTVVLYHVVGSKVPASTVVGLTEGTLVETVGGESLRVSNYDGVKVDDSNVIATDIMASNGVIHLVDEVLLPPTVRNALGLPTDRGQENVVATAVANGSFPTLIAAVQAAGLVDALSAEGPLTVFAPTEEAFANLLLDLNMTAAELLGDKELLTKVLTYHVVPGFYTSSDVMGLDTKTMFKTVNGTSLEIDPMGTVNGAKIVTPDVYTSNGVIHVIDMVLLP